MATDVEVDGAGRATGVAYQQAGSGERRHQRAGVVAIACYSIETPWLVLNSASGRLPNGLCNDDDQVGRYVMVRSPRRPPGVSRPNSMPEAFVHALLFESAVRQGAEEKGGGL